MIVFTTYVALHSFQFLFLFTIMNVWTILVVNKRIIKAFPALCVIKETFKLETAIQYPSSIIILHCFFLVFSVFKYWVKNSNVFFYIFWYIFCIFACFFSMAIQSHISSHITIIKKLRIVILQHHSTLMFCCSVCDYYECVCFTFEPLHI